MSNFDFNTYVVDSLKEANNKLDDLIVQTTKNKSTARWHTVQLYALWTILGTATTGLISFLLYCKESLR